MNAVGKQSVDLDAVLYRIDSNGTVTAEIDIFASGYCLIFPKYFPKDQHICSLPLFLRNEMFQTTQHQKHNLHRNALKAVGFLS